MSILVEGRVVWPRMGTNESGTDLAASKDVIEKLVKEARTRFENKGYRITFAEGAGVGYKHKAWKTNLIYRDYEKLGGDEHYYAPDQSPVFTFPAVENNPELADAAKRLFEAIETNIADETHFQLNYSLSDLKIVGELTESDAVCLIRGYGVKYSNARAVGSFASSLAVGLLTGGMYTGGGGNTTDMLNIYASCADTQTGKMLYQRVFAIAKNPNELESEDIDNAMVYFPNANQTIPKDCKPMDDNELFYSCD